MNAYRITFKSGSEETIWGDSYPNALSKLGMTGLVVKSWYQFQPSTESPNTPHDLHLQSITTYTDSTGHHAVFMFHDHNSKRWDGLDDETLDLIHDMQKALRSARPR